MSSSKMRLRNAAVLLLTAACLLWLPAGKLQAERRPEGGLEAERLPNGERPVLDMFTVTVDAAGLNALRRAGNDIVTTRHVGDKIEVDLVLWRHQAPQLAAEGLAIRPWTSPDGRTAHELAVDQTEAGFKVWKPFDGPGGLRAEIEKIARDHPDIVKLVQTGQSVQGRPILALKVTKDANTVPDGTRPAVFYQSLQHAREWIGGEVARRLLWYFVNGYGKNELATGLVDSRELWFVLAQNPDGYQLTHTADYRLWRKTLSDNNGDGKFTPATDGVDPNRNFPEHWGFDNEGSDPNPASWTYRGPSAGSEPETQATMALLKRVPFTFMVNYHSVAGLLLYGPGWQVDTAMADDPISEALSGTDAAPAIPDTDPQTSGDLYITNGENCDYALYAAKTLCWTPELTDGGSGGGFVFPDDEAMVEQEFQDNLPFALDIAQSAENPTRPISHLGSKVWPMYPAPFAVSYGDPQPVQVNAARFLGDIKLKWSVNGGPEQSGTTAEWKGGKRYGSKGDIYYHRVRGEVTGAHVGDQVSVWFQGGAIQTTPFSYTLVADTGRPVLVVADEAERFHESMVTAQAREGVAPGRIGDLRARAARTDLTRETRLAQARLGDARAAPNHDTEPAYLHDYLEALRANGMAADVYDVQANGEEAPSPLGVLGHYGAVVWYGGDEPVTWLPGQEYSQMTRLPQLLQLAMRDYLNEGGRLLYAGQWSAFPYFQGWSFNPYGDVGCDDSMRCKPLTDDFMQYYMGVGGYSERTGPEQVTPNRAGSGGGLWSGAENNLDQRLVRRFDLSAVTGKVVFGLNSWWQTETGGDFGYVEVSTDGGTTWTGLKDDEGKLIDRSPTGDERTWAINGSGSGLLHFDLSAYAGKTVDLRLRYTTDIWNPRLGWWVDNLTLEAGGKVIYRSDLSDGAEDWANLGWRKVPFTVPAVHAPDVRGDAGLFEGLDWGFRSPEGHPPTHLGALQPTNLGLAPGTFPLWDSLRQGLYDRAGDRPHSGQRSLHSASGLEGYQRLTRTIDLTGKPTALLDFWASYDTVKEYQALFVEAHTVGEDDWTTLADVNGHTSPLASLASVCTWELDQMTHYTSPVTDTLDYHCRPSGTTGRWYAATGASDGWEHWQVDLSRFAGRQVEVSISYLNLYYQSPGVWLDDVSLSTGGTTSFEDDLGGWVEVDPPPDHPKAAGPFTRVTAADYPMGAAVTTADTVLFGFGLETVAGADIQRELLGRAMRYLLRDREWRAPLFLPRVYRAN